MLSVSIFGFNRPKLTKGDELKILIELHEKMVNMIQGFDLLSSFKIKVINIGLKLTQICINCAAG